MEALESEMNRRSTLAPTSLRMGAHVLSQVIGTGEIIRGRA
jgi:hypothetical protein